MVLPYTLYPFQNRTLSASSTSSGTVVLSVVVPSRGKLRGVTVGVSPAVGQTGAATVDFTLTPCGLSPAAAILGSTIAGLGTTALGAGAVTTTTAGSFYFEPTASVFVNQGDILSFSSTGIPGPVVGWNIKEF